MLQDLLRWTWIYAYVVLFIGLTLSFTIWQVKRKGTRAPVAFKLRRGPGESLRRRMMEFEIQFVLYLVVASLIPVLVTLTIATVFSKLIPRESTNPVVVLGVILVVFALGTVLSARTCIRRLYRFRQDRMGYLGERFVAECLEDLPRQGYSIFHDVPAKGAERSFNLDHVIVGPSGVWVVETKTYRKGKARPGFAPHEITFDGRHLIWPWGESRQPLVQIEALVRWLSTWLHERTALNPTIRAVIALPGWMVNERATVPVRVLNPKQISSIVASARPALDAKQIDLICRQLDALCRDVED